MAGPCVGLGQAQTATPPGADAGAALGTALHPVVTEPRGELLETQSRAGGQQWAAVASSRTQRSVGWR